MNEETEHINQIERILYFTEEDVKFALMDYAKKKGHVLPNEECRIFYPNCFIADTITRLRFIENGQTK